MMAVEVLSLQPFVAGFSLLQVFQIWLLSIKLGLEGWNGVLQFSFHQ